MKTLESIMEQIEKTFMNVALVEGELLSEPLKDIKIAEKIFECSFVDVTFAEAGAFTETACIVSNL